MLARSLAVAGIAVWLGSCARPVDDASSQTSREEGEAPPTIRHREVVCGGVVFRPFEENAYGYETSPRLASGISLDRDALARALEEARTLARGDPGGSRAALRAYARAEDLALDMRDSALKTGDPDGSGYFGWEHREILEESDAFATATMTPEFVANVPWTDLLAEEGVASWQSHGVQGFRIDDGRLSVLGPAPGSEHSGVIGVSSGDGFRDFELEMVFALRGEIDLLFRLGSRVDDTVEFSSFTTDFAVNEPLIPGAKYTLKVTCIGSIYRGSLVPEDAPFNPFESRWTKSRKGAIGFQIHPGAGVSIFRMRIRRLPDA
jgi:hypothetical protein